MAAFPKCEQGLLKKHKSLLTRVVFSKIVELVVFKTTHFYEWLDQCVKSVRIQEFFWPVFSPNEGKYRPEKLQIPPFFTHWTGVTNAICLSRVRFNDSWFVLHDSSWSFHETYFSKRHIFHESYRVNRTHDYGLKTGKLVPNYSTLTWSQNILINDFHHPQFLYQAKVL